MTDQKDYATLSEVLAWLGWKREGFMGMVPDGKREKIVMRYNLIDATGINKGEHAQPTLSELWEGLCRVCRETGWFQPVLYGDAETLVSGPDPMGERVFKVNEYGSLLNAIAAALHWVLQQREG